MMTCLKKSLFILFPSVLLLINMSHANTPTMIQTKSQLKQIENKMNQLQRHINKTHDKQSVINKELSNTEKQLHQGQEQIKKTQRAMLDKQRRMTALAQQIKLLSDQLSAQKELLAQHVRAYYKINRSQPINSVLNPDKENTTNRLLTLNRYLVRKREQAIGNINNIKKSLLFNQNKFHQELVSQEHIQQVLTKRQQAYDNEKRYRKSLMSALEQEIKNQQQTLLTYKRNKANLSHLLAVLAQKSVIQTRHPFTQMRRKLHKPVATNSHGVQKINQGVVFFSNEGAPVSSIFPGKIVFADWLNGYGLLLIIDHGRGSMTLYGNNKSLLKHKGEIVNQGEKIALVGHSGTLKENGLYFEIRQRGKAVNPLEWMS